MSQETVVYIVNLIIGAILAAMMTQHWRLEASGSSLRYWILAAWTLTAADLMFAIRGSMPYWFRLVPTLTVTAGHAMLLLSAERTAERPARTKLAISIFAAHAVALIAFLLVEDISGWRTIFNGVIWGGLSIGAVVALRSAPERIRGTMLVPTLVLAFQGGFHAVRTFLATQAVVTPDAGRSALVQLLGDLEVSLFMVALFVSVLVAHLRISNANVRQLAALLPLCAWCKKVRDDDGYWTQLEEYLELRRIHVTHGICESCEAKLMASKAAAGLPSTPTA